MEKTPNVIPVLNDERLVQSVLGVEVGDHLRCERLVAVPRSARDEMHQNEGQERDNEQNE
jgi:hypothetical protein